MKIEINNRWTGAVIFSHEAEENSIKIAVEAAVSARVSMRDADLRYSDLSGSNLRNEKALRRHRRRACFEKWCGREDLNSSSMIFPLRPMAVSKMKTSVQKVRNAV